MVNKKLIITTIILSLLLAVPVMAKSIEIGEEVEFDGGTIKIVSVKEPSAFQKFLDSIFGTQLINVNTPSGEGVGKTYSIMMDTTVSEQPGRVFINIAKRGSSGLFNVGVTSFDVSPAVTCGTFPCRIQAFVEFTPSEANVFRITASVTDVTNSFNIQTGDTNQVDIDVPQSGEATTTSTQQTQTTSQASATILEGPIPAPSSIKSGDDIQIGALIRNTGSETETFTVKATIEGFSGSKQTTICAGCQRGELVTIENVVLANGDYNPTFEVLDGTTVLTSRVGSTSFAVVNPGEEQNANPPPPLTEEEIAAIGETSGELCTGVFFTMEVKSVPSDAFADFDGQFIATGSELPRTIPVCSSLPLEITVRKEGFKDQRSTFNEQEYLDVCSESNPDKLFGCTEDDLELGIFTHRVTLLDDDFACSDLRGEACEETPGCIRTTLSCRAVTQEEIDIEEEKQERGAPIGSVNFVDEIFNDFTKIFSGLGRIAVIVGLILFGFVIFVILINVIPALIPRRR